MTIVEFLLARITEDEDWAVASLNANPLSGRFDVSRVLEECEAKRRIVELECRYRTTVQRRGDSWEHWATGQLRALAAIYATHPDYRDGWRK